MSSRFERIMHEVKLMCHSERARVRFHMLQGLLLEENEHNFSAHVRVGHVEEETWDVSDFEWTEDYEILTGDYVTEVGDRYTEEEREDLLSELMDIMGDLEEKLEECPGDDVIEAELSIRMDEHQELGGADMEWDEIYVNVVYSYGYDGVIDMCNARRVGMGVLQREVDNVQFLFFTGCGMDMRPKLIAYKALTFGFIDELDVSYMERNLSYFPHLVSREVMADVIERLGVAHCVDENGKLREAA